MLQLVRVMLKIIFKMFRDIFCFESDRIKNFDSCILII